MSPSKETPDKVEKVKISNYYGFNCLKYTSVKKVWIVWIQKTSIWEECNVYISMALKYRTENLILLETLCNS